MMPSASLENTRAHDIDGRCLLNLCHSFFNKPCDIAFTPTGVKWLFWTLDA